MTVTHSRPSAVAATRQWKLEDLLEPGQRGAAHAAARQGNVSAQRALHHLRDALAALNVDGTPPAAAKGRG